MPALLYSVNAVWFMMASNDHFRLSNSMLGTATSTVHETISSPNNNDMRLSVQLHSPSSFIQQNFRKSHDGFMRLPDDSHLTLDSSSNPFATQTTLQAPDDTDRPSTPRQEEATRKATEPENDEEDGKSHTRHALM